MGLITAQSVDPALAAEFASNRRMAWWMVVIATIVHNSATGLAFSAFGAMVLGIEDTFGGDRQSSSLAIALMLLSFLITSALGARLVERMPLRRVMAAGAVLAATGYGLAAMVTSMSGVIACYGLLIGPGIALFGPVTCNTLITRWMRGGPAGRALGISNMPIFAVLAPLVAHPVAEAYGVRTLLVIVALLQLCLLPLIAAIREHPPHAADRVSREADSNGTPLPIRVILGTAAFWLVTLGYSIGAGAGSMKGAHFLPLLVDQGRTTAEGAMLLSLSGGAGIFGAVIFGWLSDRYGPALALALGCFVQALTWALFLLPLSMLPLILDAIVNGICSAGIVAPFSMMLVRIFGLSTFPRAYGLGALATIPFIFGMTPIAGMLYVRTGSYILPFSITIGLLLLAALLLLVAHGLRRRYPTALPQTVDETMEGALRPASSPAG